MSADYIWTPPQYNVSHLPSQIGIVHLPPDPDFPENFIRTAKWCPDGSTALTHSENRRFHFLEFTSELLQTSIARVPPGLEKLTFTRHISQPSSILEFAWYPLATIQDPASFCFIASVRDTPVRLIDASDGRLRASYRIVDHRERQVAPHSVVFNLTADKLYCGFDSAIEVFDVNRPGEGTRILTSPSKKSRDGMKGIISSLSFSPSSSAFYAAGTLAPTLAPIGLYDATIDEPVMYLGLGDADRNTSGGGVTQLCFNPTKPHLLYGSFRRCRHIYAWDIRQATGEPICKYQFVQPHSGGSQKMTNQRLRFDIDIGGRWLSVGNQDGYISMFDLNLEIEENVDIVQEFLPTLTFKAHEDAVGSVSFHPLQPMLLSVSGSRHFDTPTDQTPPTSSDSDSNSSESDDRDYVVRKLRAPHPCTLDASVKIWAFDGGELRVDRGT